MKYDSPRTDPDGSPGQSAFFLGFPASGRFLQFVGYGITQMGDIEEIYAAFTREGT
jgi:hypothetical protein